MQHAMKFYNKQWLPGNFMQVILQIIYYKSGAL